MLEGPIVGIDLGTTNSLCAIFRNGNPELIPNALGHKLTPSVVGVLPDGQIVVGQSARELQVTQPDRVAACFKRWMGTDRRIEIGGETFDSHELSSLVLRSLREDAENFLGMPVLDAVVTVPAYFNDHQRKATQLAGRMAGLNVRRIINEPTAAALTYGFHDRQAEKKLIVIDLGGGTFDVTVMDVFEGALEIVSTAGETQLGGEDFTTRLVAQVLQSQSRQLESCEMQFPRYVARLREKCEAAKRTLGQQESTTIAIPDDDGRFSDSPPTVTVRRSDLSQWFQPLVQRLERPIARALRDARLETGEISEVILVGGATRDRTVQEYVSQLFDCQPHAKVNPDEVVALGAAVQAALIVDDRAVDDMVMTDVCPFTLGVQVVKQFGNKEMPGYYLPVIHRNTTIPVSREEIVATTNANQRRVAVQIFQGESRKVSDNLPLGELLVEDIPSGPAGQPVHIRFTYDLNGILEVEAYIPQTGKKFQTVLTNHAEGLSPQELASAVNRMQQVKFYPRDNVRHQRLLRFAEKAIGEVSPFQRDELEAAIDGFEHAMESGDREWFEQMRTSLLLTLSALGLQMQDGDDE
ncbi:Hsp70 family protein [Roseimaritima ulvae]|uniref:Chaperone protein HscC n=1 Tax=Roseimaritima ulvae TaxID=980254 RepID=A0A5B9RAA8_9BACT|nr:Hsp70 family protein [Roseimaritima ulvae]QEG43833.1 Chaperone protein HscC [Roseimaritima ulvae]